jgi:hypothetical protein
MLPTSSGSKIIPSKKTEYSTEHVTQATSSILKQETAGSFKMFVCYLPNYMASHICTKLGDFTIHPVARRYTNEFSRLLGLLYGIILTLSKIVNT